MHVVTEIDLQTGALFARNPYNTEFPGRVAFLDLNESTRTITGDRTEFLGRNGTLRNPAAMGRTRLSGKVGVGLDPCGAIQVRFELARGQEREIVFSLGVGRDVEEASEPGPSLSGICCRARALEGVWHYWQRTLGTVHVETPDQGINAFGQWLAALPNLRCRLWGRSGYYQSGGAFGFRDQLAGLMALVHAEPRLCASICCGRGAPVPGGRCSALVASPLRSRRAHTLFRRLPVAAPGHMPLRAEHR